MARARRTVTIDEKIDEAKAKVLRDKARYEMSCKELEDLYAKREAKRRGDMWKAVVKSDRTYEEIMAFVSCPSCSE